MSRVYTDRECIERVMTNHWDMVSCPCVICTYGRSQGWSAQKDYLGESSPSCIGEGRPTPQQQKVMAGAEHCGDPLCELCSPEDLIPNFR